MKNSLIGRFPGTYDEMFAQLRLLYMYQYAHPGKKLLFMGGEFGQWDEWYHEKSLDWSLLENPLNQGMHRWIQNLNHLYKSEPALHEVDFSHDGFEWVDFHDADASVLSFMRKGKSTDDIILISCNFTPVPRLNYRFGVPRSGF
jgi:1,4-alpha-glucan branching enzyme